MGEVYEYLRCQSKKVYPGRWTDSSKSINSPILHSSRGPLDDVVSSGIECFNAPDIRS